MFNMQHPNADWGSYIFPSPAKGLARNCWTHCPGIRCNSHV